MGCGIFVVVFMYSRFDLNVPPSITFDSDQIKDADIDRESNIPAVFRSTSQPPAVHPFYPISLRAISGNMLACVNIDDPD